ncbi:MAG: phytoene/squalene synthase family protein [Nitrospinota bacterium]
MADPRPTLSAKALEALPAITPADRKRLLTDLLRGVSRTFYLTLRVLPKGLREPVGLAYLLARAADTIADTRILPPSERVAHLLAFRAQVEGPASAQALRETGLALREKRSLPAEKDLLTSLPEAFSLLEATPENDRNRVRSVVVTLTRGMEFDLTAFPREDSGQIVALKQAADLDRHTYYAAGCVGEFWTGITTAHTSALKGWDAERMGEIGVRFGKALQLTNVLRDVPKDLRLGRCYLPEPELAHAGVTPEALLNPATGAKARPVLVGWIEAALGHYGAAEEYLLSIPRRCLRLRLGALWPILIGLATLAELGRNEEWLDPAWPSKVSRNWVRRMLLLSPLAASSDRLLRAWIGQLRGQVEESLYTRGKNKMSGVRPEEA